MGSSGKTVSLKDEDWMFLFDEFKSESPSEAIEKLIQSYKSKKGK